MASKHLFYADVLSVNAGITPVAFVSGWIDIPDNNQEYEVVGGTGGSTVVTPLGSTCRFKVETDTDANFISQETASDAVLHGSFLSEAGPWPADHPTKFRLSVEADAFCSATLLGVAVNQITI